MKLALWVLATSLAATALSLWLIGFPGTCGFTGVYGNRLASTSIGFVAAINLFYIPILGVFVGILGIFIAGIGRWTSRNNRMRGTL